MKQPRQLSQADLDILRRIERVPFGRFQWRLLWMGGLGYTFDAMDGAMIGVAALADRTRALGTSTRRGRAHRGRADASRCDPAPIDSVEVPAVSARGGVATAGKSLEPITAEAVGPTDP